MSAHLAIEMVMQKSGTDCGAASLAMLFGRGYSDVRAVCNKNIEDVGMTNAHTVGRSRSRWGLSSSNAACMTNPAPRSITLACSSTV
jgi:hypothetical protein